MPDAIATAPIDWTLCGTLTLTQYESHSPWLLLAELVADATLLKITADGEYLPWPGFDGLSSGPSGLTGLRLSADALMLADAPPGSLIGKIGGGAVTLVGWSTGTSPGIGLDGKPFGIGDLCILQVPRQIFGPVFVGVNSAARPARIIRLTVTLHSAIATPAAAAK
jgi:hypothetical protein